MKGHLRRRCFLTALLAAMAGSRSVRGAPPSLVAAASDLRFVLPELARRFQKHTGLRLRLVFGSSGKFHRQILAGAPFSLFLSADAGYVRRILVQTRIDLPHRVYALGRIVLFAPTGSPLRVDPRLDGLEESLQAGAISRFAIANPDHAPYGSRARQALLHRGLWEKLRPFLVLGENIAQAAQFAASGRVQGAILAESLARSERLADKGRSARIPASWHQPLRQTALLLRPEDGPARRFYEYLATSEARMILARSGFALPPTEARN